MNRTSRMLAVAFAAAALATIAVAIPAQAKTIEVKPGQSIQAAVDSASPGDTVMVDAGTYHQNVHVNKDDITLQGSGDSSSGTVLLPPAHPKGQLGGEGIAVFGKIDQKTGKVLRRSKGVKISGFLIKGFKDSGIFAFGADGFVFSKNMVVDNGGYGIVGFDQHQGKYLNNVAVGSGEAGFYVGDSPKAYFVGKGNDARRNKYGFFLRDASHGLAENNTATGNCMGFLILNSGSPGPAAGWTLRNNQSSKNDKLCKGSKQEHTPPFSGTGIGLAGATNSVVTGNTVQDNVPVKTKPPLAFAGGIVLVSSQQFGGSIETGNTVSNNTAHGNKPVDIKWDGKGHNTFKANTCDASKPSGLCH